MIKDLFKLEKVGGVIIVLILTLIAYFYFNNKDKEMVNNGRFTVATIVKTFGMKGGKACEYSYSVNSKEYVESNYLNGSVVNFKKYFVIFEAANPQNSKIFLEIPVPDTINEVPVNGWEKIPIPFEKKSFDIEFN